MAAEDKAHVRPRWPGGAACGRRRPDARRHHAAIDPGSAARRRHRHPRPARPPPRRTRREFLAIPPLRFRRAGVARRLAALGARRSSLRARTGMGSRTHGLDLARSLALDGVRFAAGRATPSFTARSSWPWRSPKFLVEGGERVGIPGLMRPTGSRNVIERMAQAIVHDRGERASLPPNFSPSPLAEIVLLSDLWSDIADIRRTIAQLVRRRRARACGADRRSGRRDVSVFGPHRIRRAGRRRPHHRRPGADLARRL